MTQQLVIGIVTALGLAMVAYLNMSQNMVLTSTQNDTPIYDSFHHWKVRHNKHFGADENNAKFQVYKQNLQFVHNHNKDNKEENSLKLELNQFADLTNQQFKQIYHGYIHQEQQNPSSLQDADIPDQFDWREKGAVTNVKNQGQCGSCWAFSTTGALEGMHFIKTGKLLEFSEQQLVDCSGPAGNMGCNGGLMDNAFKYIEENGITVEQSYPYKAFMAQCDIPKNSDLIKIAGYVDVPKSSNKQLLLAINKGPVSVAIDAESSFFQLYKSGVYQQECGTNLDHGVLLVGYGEEDGVKFFTIKNSWGPQWGEQGYIRILRNDNDDAGQCGIRLSASYPQETKDIVSQ